uniref:Uncharacterized protein n=1 Tax=Cannabis sativa TaxID=3483 RepID=A0A803QZV8_CANSA
MEKGNSRITRLGVSRCSKFTMNSIFSINDHTLCRRGAEWNPRNRERRTMMWLAIFFCQRER